MKITVLSLLLIAAAQTEAKDGIRGLHRFGRGNRGDRFPMADGPSDTSPGFFFGRRGRGGHRGPGRRNRGRWILGHYLREWAEDATVVDLNCDEDPANVGAPVCHRDNRGTVGAWACRTLYNPLTGEQQKSTVCGAVDANIENVDVCGCCPGEEGSTPVCPPVASCELSCETPRGEAGFWIEFTKPEVEGEEPDMPEEEGATDTELGRRMRVRCLTPEFATTVLATVEAAQCATEAPGTDGISTVEEIASAFGVDLP